MSSHLQAHREALDDGLILRTMTSDDDVERIAAFNGSVHGPEIVPMTRILLREYPGIEPADQVLVETPAGEIVSALCLIPWTWRYEAIDLPVGEMGIVGTAEAYRGRGLVRRQVAYFKQRLRERGCVLSNIQGIANFYRQFGYQYALPLEGGYRWELRHVPESKTDALSIRQAAMEDLPALATMYNLEQRRLCISAVRTDEIWRYLLSVDDRSDAMVHDTWIVEDAANGSAPVGYMRVPYFHFGDELVIDEAHAQRHDVAMALVDHAKGVAEKREKPGLRLNLAASSYFVQLALAHNATALGTYAWQIHIPDDAALLRAIAPALEARLEDSPFAGWTGTYRIGFYNRALHLLFSGGKLTDVVQTKEAEADANMPYAAFAPLVLGHRDFDEMHTQYPDASVHGVDRLLMDTLFPKRESFIQTVY